MRTTLTLLILSLISPLCASSPALEAPRSGLAPEPAVLLFDCNHNGVEDAIDISIGSLLPG